MIINLEKVVPLFLEEEKIARSAIWGKSLTFSHGEKIQVIAPSGSGKTSLIHFLYGLRKDYSGEISFDKKNISSFFPETFSKLRTNQISIIFQDLRLFGEQTVRENIEVKRVLQPFHAQSRVNEMAETLGIANKLERPVKTCSYGEQQRVAIIRALQQPFDFLIMDEPFSHLDESNRKIATALLEQEANERNAGIILADLKAVEYFNAGRSINL